MNRPMVSFDGSPSVGFSPTADESRIARDGRVCCPIGTGCGLRVVSREQLLCECTPDDPGHRCPKALSFGGAFFCCSLWKMPLAKG